MVSKLNTGRKAGESFGGAMGRIYKDIGFGGLWNGLPVRYALPFPKCPELNAKLMLDCSIVMIGTLTGLQWLIYDSFKLFMGLPTTGGAPPPEKQEKS